jgi:hypothetical protein
MNLNHGLLVSGLCKETHKKIKAAFEGSALDRKVLLDFKLNCIDDMI